ncbi:MAG: polyphosphate polymerase domain-containing protein [Lachnospiraceae bacterium]|nr:polyphosphate polymerase domain-containing protein [Lachnospiraceae bacterium]
MFEQLDGFRHEFKYIEPEINLIGVQSRLSALMKRDSHVGANGYYSIRSMYFDDYADSYLNQNIDGVDERIKWRIRIYNRSTGLISLERKIKKADLIRKQACSIDIDTYKSIISRRPAISESNPALLNMFIREMRTEGLRPTVIVEYERWPFVCSRGNVRVTIDRNIRSSRDFGRFLSCEAINCRPVLHRGQNLIEVKYDSFLPDHIAHAVEHGRMRRETFSKYYLARKFPYGGRII